LETLAKGALGAAWSCALLQGLALVDAFLQGFDNNHIAAILMGQVLFFAFYLAAHLAGYHRPHH
jgi:hypothetical protein